MSKISSKSRILKAMNHQTPDRIPIDFGSTAVTGIHVSCIEGLRKLLGLEYRPVKVIEPYQMLGLVEDDLRSVLDLDTKPVFTPNNLFGFKNEGWKAWRTPWGQETLVPDNFIVAPNAKGGIHIYPCGDTSAPPSAHMPEGGFFFDTIIRQEPLDEDNLVVEDNLEEFQPLNPTDLDHYRREAEEASTLGHAVVATTVGTAFGDIALVPAPFLKHPKGIRDIEEWYVSVCSRQEHVCAIFEKQCDIALKNLAKINAVAGDKIDVVFLCGTDFGTQTSQFCSADTYREIYKPYYTRVNEWIHRNTKWKTMKHSCGAIRPLMRELIESGFDIINPVQCSATGMEASDLKRDFGADIVFWGGGVDTQKTLPFGTPVQVRKEVLQRCEIFSKNGGFIFDSIHNLQARTPLENLLAMFNAVREFNGQPQLQV